MSSSSLGHLVRGRTRAVVDTSTAMAEGHTDSAVAPHMPRLPHVMNAGGHDLFTLKGRQSAPSKVEDAIKTDGLLIRANTVALGGSKSLALAQPSPRADHVRSPRADHARSPRPEFVRSPRPTLIDITRSVDFTTSGVTAEQCSLHSLITTVHDDLAKKLDHVQQKLHNLQHNPPRRSGRTDTLQSNTFILAPTKPPLQTNPVPPQVNPQVLQSTPRVTRESLGRVVRVLSNTSDSSKESAKDLSPDVSVPTPFYLKNVKSVDSQSSETDSDSVLDRDSCEPSPVRGRRGSKAVGGRRGSNTSSLSPSTRSAARILHGIRRAGKTVSKLRAFLNDPDSSSAARAFALSWDCFIVFTVVVSAMQTIRPAPMSGELAAIVDITFDAFFTLEVLVRYAVATSTCAWLKNVHNIIDLLAAVPALVLRAGLIAGTALGGCSFAECTLLHDSLQCVVPVLRVFKSLRRFQKFHLFLTLMGTILEALRVLLFALFILVLTFSCLIYLVEPRSNVSTIPQAMWLTIVTVTTVGYGDVTPKSWGGTLIVGILVMCSVLYMAMPIGIIGNAFTQIWQDRDRILLMLRTRERLAQWGYAARDLVHLFDHFDADEDNNLSIAEFRKMINEMQLGLSEDRISELFDSIDKDSSGGIDCKELVRALFPHAFHEIFRPVSPIAEDTSDFDSSTDSIADVPTTVPTVQVAKVAQDVPPGRLDLSLDSTSQFTTTLPNEIEV